MIIMINGAFGVGKTTVARILVNRISNSTLFDPEIIGFVLRRLPHSLLLETRSPDDFQDFILWRKLTILTAVLLHKIGRRTVIMPMTFSNLAYLNQIRFAFLRDGITVHHFCLTASVEVVQKRLMERGVSPSSAAGKWVYPRATYCCKVHSAPEFSQHITTDERLPSAVADEILERIETAV